MPERVPRIGERVGFVDDGYAERAGEVVDLSEFFGQVMLSVRPEGPWPVGELGDDGTIPLALEECFEVAPRARDLRSASEWSTAFGITVHDADGWDRSRFDESWAERITEAEFARRASASTCTGDLARLREVLQWT